MCVSASALNQERISGVLISAAAQLLGAGLDSHGDAGAVPDSCTSLRLGSSLIDGPISLLDA
jgi:hypothetical protein